MTFANIRNEEIIDFNSLYLDKDITRVETSEEIYQAYIEDKDKVIYKDGEVILNPDWEEEQKRKERERIAQLHLTRGDVFRALLMAKGVTRTQLRAVIENLPEETNEQSIAKEMALIDFDEALDFYRGVALIDTVGAQLGITPEQMDRFFETNDWHELVTVEPEPEEETDDNSNE